MHSHTHCNTVHNSQDVEGNKVSLSGWMNKENVLYAYNGLLLSLKREVNSAICKNIDES